MIEGKYQYFAFISYQRRDEEWAKWLQHKLEHYKLPSNLNGRTDLPKEIRPVFKDTSELMPGNLPEQIHHALDLSKYLIVVCSPRSAQSEWVNKEIETFISMGKTTNVIPFIIDGKAFAGNSEEECFPLALRQLPKEQEILGANINEMGRDAAAVKVVARMFDVRFDELWQRHEREQRRRRNIITATVAVFIMAVAGVAFWMYLQRQETLKANWEMMENQARMVAEKSKEEIKKGNTYDAILALLEMIPQDGSRPFVPELEAALRIAYDSMQKENWIMRNIKHDYDRGHKYDNSYFSEDGKYIIGVFGKFINIYETKSLHLISEIVHSDMVSGSMAYISPTNDTIFVLDDMFMMCYHIPDGQLVAQKPYTKDILKQSMAACSRRIAYSEDEWTNKWKKSVSLPQNVTIIDYNPIKEIALIRQDIETGDNYDNHYLFYDCSRKKIIKKLDDFNWVPFDLEGSIASTSFSSDGNKLAISIEELGGDTGLIIDMNDYSSKHFNCGNPDCWHYSNTLIFANNNRFLHYSQSTLLEIYDGKTLSIVDSIFSSPYLSESIPEMNPNGDVCLVGSDVFYKCKLEKSSISVGGFGKLDQTFLTGDIIKESRFERILELQMDTIINQRHHIYFYDGHLEYNDLLGINAEWITTETDDIIDIIGFVQDNKYMLILRESSMTDREGEMEDDNWIDIIDVVTGNSVYKINQSTSNIYYNKDSEQFAFGNDEGIMTESIIDFPSFDHLLQLCREATQGMVLSKDARKRLYLNKAKD